MSRRCPFDIAVQFLIDLNARITRENMECIETFDRKKIVNSYLCQYQHLFQQCEFEERAVKERAALQCKERLFAQHHVILSEFQPRASLSAEQRTEFQVLTQKIRNEMHEQAELGEQGWDVVEGPR